MERAEFIYASAKTFDRAQAILEDMFANGEISEGERPRIVLQSVRGRLAGPPLYHRSIQPRPRGPGGRIR